MPPQRRDVRILAITQQMIVTGELKTAIESDEQRDLARWLIDRGVDLVVGSHPHCVQSIDFYQGRPIAYSLGNLVFDGAPMVASWNRGALLEVDLNEDAKISSVSLIPVVLEDGLPRLDGTEGSRFGSR